MLLLAFIEKSHCASPLTSGVMQPADLLQSKHVSSLCSAGSTSKRSLQVQAIASFDEAQSEIGESGPSTSSRLQPRRGCQEAGS